MLGESSGLTGHRGSLATSGCAPLVQRRLGEVVAGPGHLLGPRDSHVLLSHLLVSLVLPGPANILRPGPTSLERSFLSELWRLYHLPLFCDYFL